MWKCSLLALLLGLNLTAIGCESESDAVTAPDAESPEIIGGGAAGNDSSGESGEVAE